MCSWRPVLSRLRSLAATTSVPFCRTDHWLPASARSGARWHAPGFSAGSSAAPGWPAAVPVAAVRVCFHPPSRLPAAGRSAVNAPASPNQSDHSSVWPPRSPSPAVRAPASLPLHHPPRLETPARNHTTLPPPAPVDGTGENTLAAPQPHSALLAHSTVFLLSPKPSCSKISGEDLLLRGSFRASFRVCASSTNVPLEARLFSLHLSAAEGALCRSYRLFRRPHPVTQVHLSIIPCYPHLQKCSFARHCCFSFASISRPVPAIRRRCSRPTRSPFPRVRRWPTSSSSTIPFTLFLGVLAARSRSNSAITYCALDTKH